MLSVWSSVDGIFRSLMTARRGHRDRRAAAAPGRHAPRSSRGEASGSDRAAEARRRQPGGAAAGQRALARGHLFASVPPTGPLTTGPCLAEQW